MKARKFILAKHFVGLPKLDDFELVEEELPPIAENGSISFKVFLMFILQNIKFGYVSVSVVN